MSLLFGGSDDYAYVQSTPITDYGANGVTIAAWFRYVGSMTTLDTIATIGDFGATGPSLALIHSSDGSVNAYTRDSVSNSNCFTVNSTAKNGTDTDWHHAVGMWPDNQNRISVLDGDWANRGVASGAVRNLSGLDSVVLGCLADGLTNDFEGNVAHVAIWNRVLTQSEVEALAAGDNPLTVAADNLVAYWPLTDSGDVGEEVVGARDLTNFVSSASYSSSEPTVDPPPAGSVTITNAGDELFETGESVTITGTGFGASQGTGVVKICPTNDVNDANGVSQTVTAWSDTSITITVVRSTLSFLTGLHLFVKNDSGVSNSSGYSVQIEPKVYVRETLVDLAGNPVASQTGLRALVWRAEPTASVPNPNEVIDSLTTDGSGVTAWKITRGNLAVDDPIWLAILKSGSPYKATLRKITPSYE